MIYLPLPRYMCNILRSYELDTPTFLGKVKGDHIDSIQQYGRSDDYVIPDGAKINHYLGHRTLPSKQSFTFTPTEHDLMDEIVAAVNSRSESWWSRILKMSVIVAQMEGQGTLSTNDNQNENGVPDSARDANNVIRKAIDVETSRIRGVLKNTTNNEAIHAIIDTIKVTLQHNDVDNGISKKKLIGEIECTCKKPIVIQYECHSWNVSNFMPHYWKFHTPSEGEGKKETNKRKPPQKQDASSKKQTPGSQEVEQEGEVDKPDTIADEMEVSQNGPALNQLHDSCPSNLTNDSGIVADISTISYADSNDDLAQAPDASLAPTTPSAVEMMPHQASTLASTDADGLIPVHQESQLLQIEGFQMS
ncbi:hypothetical protein QAD02_002287 [Eretmocerus hayati]|uniref:Uncharacterized protein n=1 Tax=Eretmocerus hayati TaxID=131215 RepID=A0ACC2NJP6_9HYME|nr:hypothetical protein QAD02_002287 [Eretmocerus hayati]